MDYREDIIKMLMHDIDEQDLKFIYDATRSAYRHTEEKEESENYTQPGLSRKMKVIQLLLKIDSDKFLNRIHMSLQEHLKEKGGAA